MNIDLGQGALIGFNCMNADGTLQNFSSKYLKDYIRLPQGEGLSLPTGEWLRFDSPLHYPKIGERGWHFSTHLINAYSGFMREFETYSPHRKITMNLYAGRMDIYQPWHSNFFDTHSALDDNYAAEYRMYIGDINVRELLEQTHRRVDNQFHFENISDNLAIEWDFRRVVESQLSGTMKYQNVADDAGFSMTGQEIPEICASPFRGNRIIGVYERLFSSLIVNTMDWCYVHNSYPQTHVHYEAILQECKRNSPDPIDDAITYYNINSGSACSWLSPIHINPEIILDLMRVVFYDVANKPHQFKMTDVYAEWARSEIPGASQMTRAILEWFESTLRIAIDAQKHLAGLERHWSMSGDNRRGAYILEMAKRFAENMSLHRSMTRWLFEIVDDSIDILMADMIRVMDPGYNSTLDSTGISKIIPSLSFSAMRDIYEHSIRNHIANSQDLDYDGEDPSIFQMYLPHAFTGAK